MWRGWLLVLGSGGGRGAALEGALPDPAIGFVIVVLVGVSAGYAVTGVRARVFALLGVGEVVGEGGVTNCNVW